MAATRELLDENDTLASEALTKAKLENNRIERNIRVVLETEKNEAIERQALLPARRKMLRTALVSPRQTPVAASPSRRASSAERPHTQRSFAPLDTLVQSGATTRSPELPVRTGNRYPLRNQPTHPTPASQQQTPAAAALPAPPAKSALKKSSVSEVPQAQQQQQQAPPKTPDDEFTSEISADSLESIRASRPPPHKMGGWERTFDGRFRRRHDFRIRLPDAYTRLREQKPASEEQSARASPAASSAAAYEDDSQAAPVTPQPPPGYRPVPPHQQATSLYSTQRR